jgi:hypothetical protein
MVLAENYQHHFSTRTNLMFFSTVYIPLLCRLPHQLPCYLPPPPMAVASSSSVLHASQPPTTIACTQSALSSTTYTTSLPQCLCSRPRLIDYSATVTASSPWSHILLLELRYDHRLSPMDFLYWKTSSLILQTHILVWVLWMYWFRIECGIKFVQWLLI